MCVFSQMFYHVVLCFRILYAIALSLDVFDDRARVLARARARVYVGACCSLALYSAIEHV